MSTTHASILVVDDSPVNQRLLGGLLERAGYRIRVADGARQALVLAEEAVPDLFLLDILMPEMDGLALCRQLKAQDATRDTPVIFISSLNDTTDKLKGFEAGGVDYIIKPFHPAEVLARVATHLKLCRLQRQLEEKSRLIEAERQKSEALLLNVLPARVARELMERGSCLPQRFDQVTVCFIDIVQFTAAAATFAPELLIEELNDIFTSFDRIMGEHRCERMKTIGDAYFCVCGIPEENPQHVQDMADAVLEVIRLLEARNRSGKHQWQVRIGMHSGPVIGGIVGTKKYLYDIFGDTVNVASRLEKLSLPMRINVSSAVHQTLAGEYRFSPPVRSEIKGIGAQATYFLEGRFA